MKKLISLCALVIGFITLFNSSSLPVSAATPPDNCFNFNAGTGTITDYYDHEANDSSNPACPRDVDIPATISSTPVTAIGNSAFYENRLTSITIPDSVTSIGLSAFSYNQLVSLAIPNSVTIVNYNAFGGNQLTSVTIPNSVTTIGGNAFRGNRLTSVVFQGPVTSFGADIFQNNLITSITYDGTEHTPQLPIDDACFEMSGNTLAKYLLFDMNLIKDNGIGCVSSQVDIPSTVSGTPVTAIGAHAFYFSKITSVSIPNSVTAIGNSAFYSGQLTSITLPSSLATIGNYAFYSNKLTTVHIPSSVTSIGNTAFAVQNPYGGDIEWEFPHPDYNIWSDDPQIIQNAYDVIWYAQLYTEDPSNPAGLQDGILNEAWWWAMDANDNGHVNDSLGGHLINPAQATITYANSHGNQVQPNQTFTGLLPDNTPLFNYLASQGPALPAIDDPSSLTPEEQDELDEALSAYYRIGDTFTYTGPIIQGITPTPASYSFVLGASTEDNTKTFTYPGLASSDDPDELAETGVSQMIWLAAIAALILIGSILVNSRHARNW